MEFLYGRCWAAKAGGTSEAPPKAGWPPGAGSPFSFSWCVCLPSVTQTGFLSVPSGAPLLTCSEEVSDRVVSLVGSHQGS